MAKEKKIDLKAVAMQEMETLVEQHNELIKTIQEQQGRLSEVKNMLVEKQGYLKGLEDCDAQCDKDA
jgi:chromosome condensin MukBEF ATPase and DNA-binding subunit MukB